MIQIVGLFLVAMAVIAIIGRLRRGGFLPGPRGNTQKSRGKCRACGRPLIGRDPCPCGRGGKA